MVIAIVLLVSAGPPAAAVILVPITGMKHVNKIVRFSQPKGRPYKLLVGIVHQHYTSGRQPIHICFSHGDCDPLFRIGSLDFN